MKFFERKYLRFWFMIFGFLGSVYGFFEVADDVFQDPLEGDLEAQHFDRAISSWANRLRTPDLNQIMTDFTALGSVSVLATLLIILVSILATFRDYKGIIYLTLAGLGGGLWPTLLKMYFRRDRPGDLEHLVTVSDFSFPSGHSFGSAAIYIALAYYSGQYARSWKQESFFYLLGAALILIVGMSRIYLGVHFPTDVLAGLCGGIAWGFFISALHELYFRVKVSSSEICL